jgi:hypothetical protein
MSLLMVVVCAAHMLVTCAILARNLLKRNYDLLSWRNLFLVGFFHFVLLSGYFTASSGEGAIARGSVTSSAMGLYTLALLLFFWTFMFAARFGYRRSWPGKLLPRLELPVTSPAILASVVVLLAAALLSLGASAGYLALLAVNMRSGMAVAAVGLATFYLLAHRFNPASWAMFLGTIGAAVVISTVGGIGRRDLVAVAIAVPWMWYFMSLRYRSAASIAVFTGAGAVIGVIFLVLFTGIRFKGVDAETGKGASAGQRFSQILDLVTNPTLKHGAAKSMLYTDTANVSMFLMQNYPDSYPYTPGRSALWVLVNPVPRSLYPDKPEALGIVVANEMNRGENLGPGVLGQSWTEGGFLAVAAFALFFGVLYGAVDRALLERGSNPYFVAVMAAGAGNVLAMPRGDVALFLIQIIASMVGAGMMLYLVKLTTGRVFAAFPQISVRLPRRLQAFGSTYADEDEDDAWEDQDRPPADEYETLEPEHYAR